MPSLNERKGSTKTMSRYDLRAGMIRVEIGPKLSAFDVGSCPHEFDGIAEARRDFTARVFCDLSEKGISNHFYGALNRAGLLVDEYQVYKLKGGKMVLQEPLSDAPNGIMIPLEFICRYRIATRGFISRIESGELTRGQLNIDPNAELVVGMSIGPFVECSTKLEPKDRYLSDEEAMQIAKLTFSEMEECKQIVLKASEVVRTRAAARELDVWDLKWELARTHDGKIVVADVMTPDELRMKDSDGNSLDKDPFRNYLEGVGFKAAVEEARAAKKPLPLYPEIPAQVSMRISAGYQQAVDMFCRA